jgi:hypothetical protein
MIPGGLQGRSSQGEPVALGIDPEGQLAQTGNPQHAINPRRQGCHRQQQGLDTAQSQLTHLLQAGQLQGRQAGAAGLQGGAT